jgi:hypothetical protein
LSEPITQQPTATVAAPPPAAGSLVPAEQQPQQQLARPGREVRVVVSDILLLDTAKFEQMQRIAGAMAESSIIPDHLVAQPWWWKKNMSPAELGQMQEKLGKEEWGRSWAEAKKRTVANCFLVVEQSFRWGMSPFAVAPETYVVGGKLAYQGKLVLAVVNELAGLEGRLQFEWSGTGQERAIKIWGRFRGETVDREDTLTLKQAKTDNKMWTADPDQKLLYSGILHWARRWCPEVVLGVKSVEDLERIEEDERLRGPQRLGSALDAFAAAGELPAGPPAQVIDVTGTPQQEAPAASAAAAPAAEVREREPGEDDAGADGQLPLGGGKK